jgi:hypothetical protein
MSVTGAVRANFHEEKRLMRNFVTKSGPGLLAIVMMAGLGYFALTPPRATAQPAVVELGFHSADCAVCRLPLIGKGAEASRYGHDFHSHDGAAVSSVSTN